MFKIVGDTPHFSEKDILSYIKSPVDCLLDDKSVTDYLQQTLNNCPLPYGVLVEAVQSHFKISKTAAHNVVDSRIHSHQLYKRSNGLIDYDTSYNKAAKNTTISTQYYTYYTEKEVIDFFKRTTPLSYESLIKAFSAFFQVTSFTAILIIDNHITDSTLKKTVDNFIVYVGYQEVLQDTISHIKNMQRFNPSVSITSKVVLSWMEPLYPEVPTNDLKALIEKALILT